MFIRNGPSEEEVFMITSVTAGNEANSTLTHLFERYNAEIFAYLCHMLRDREAAEDLAQETFLQATRTGDNLRQVNNQRAWLYRIATNLALNALKRRRRFAWLPWVETRDSESDTAEQVGKQAALEQALAALSPEHRAPLLLYAHYGFSVAEVAEALSISESAVKMRLCRAREMFRQAYERGNAR
jgi:RNA polymerase sigma-70 factor (ECF subfamily)